MSSEKASGNPLINLVAGFNDLLSRIPEWIPLLMLRLTAALPFWNSGLTKWDGFLQISPATNYLFTNEFKLHLLGAEIPYPFPEALAFLSSVGEIALPVLLVLGLGTRFAALGLLIMTAVIQLTIPDGWMNFHLPWAAMLLPLVTYGAGRFSLDHLLFKD